ncbi:MAG TPA: tetratricopeptide repeat protein [Opitutaceae bacterium]|nr:tetratricopeptide repeat protein [Opitutaceae bacterium]
MRILKTALLPLPLLALANFAWAAGAAKDSAAPSLDPNRIINESYGFLKNREPEMTATEYALYDKVVSLIAARPEYAMKLLETMMGDKTPASPAFEFVLGNAHYATGKHELAITHYRRAVEKYPDFLRAWTNLGITCYAAGRHAEAVPCFNKALSLGDRAASTYGLLGYCLAKADNPLAAEMAYLQAFALDPDNPDWIQALAQLLVGTKQYARAEALVRQLIRLKPAESHNWMLHATILIAQERRIDAIAVLETATRLGALSNAGQLALGDLYAEQGFHAEAVTTYRATMENAPDAGAQRLLRFAQSLIATRKLSEAQRVLDTAPAAASRDTKVLYWETKAALSFANKDHSGARQALESVLELETLNGRALLGLGELHASGGNPTKARLLYEQASQLPAFAYQANLELASLALDAKDPRKSAAHLRTALSLQRSPALQDYLARVSALVPSDEN